MFWPCETRTSTCRSFATISSGLNRFLAIAVLLDVKDIPQVGPLQWRWITTVEALMNLRKRLDEMLLERRAELERKLERRAVVAVARRVVRGGGSALKGRKAPPKYRSPAGDTWAGRGAKPRWLVAAIKGGNKLDDFLINKSARKGRKKRRSKR